MEEAFDRSTTLQRTAHVLNVHDISSFDPRHTGKNFRTAAIPSCGVTDGVTDGAPHGSGGGVTAEAERTGTGTRLSVAPQSDTESRTASGGHLRSQDMPLRYVLIYI